MTAIDVFVALKHGTIRGDLDYLETLPEEVIHRAYTITCEPESRPSSLEVLILGLMFRQPANKEKAFNAITQALREYYGREY